MSGIFFFLSKCVVRSFFFLFTRWHISGRENIPHDGPVIVVSNHMTFAEPCIVCLTMGRDTMFAAKEGFFRNPLLRWAMASFHAFPVFQGKADRETLRKMEGYLEQGLALGIFPEGMRSLSASLIPALNGTALIAQRTGAPILPIGIWGTEKMKGVRWYFTRPAIKIRFGKPFNIPPETSKQGRGVGTHLIMEHIAELLPPEYRGAYAIEGPTVCK